TSGGGRFGLNVAGPATLTTVGVAGVGSIIAFTTVSGTLAAFSAFRPSTLVSKFVPPPPEALVVLILARITSSQMPALTIATTSWLVRRRLIPESSALNAGGRRKRANTSTVTNDRLCSRTTARPILQSILPVPPAGSRKRVANTCTI